MVDIVRKTLAVKSDGMTFVLSDETPDRYGDIIRANGWRTANFKNNPIALFNHNSDFPIGNWENIRVKDKKLVGDLKPAPEGTSDRIDEIRRLIDAGVLKAVSVGFKPIKSEPIGDDSFGRIYTDQELVETSLVSVPANPNALAIAKSMNISREVMDVVFAKHGTKDGVITRGSISGEHAKKSSQSEKSKTMSISQRIEDTQNKINAYRDQLNNHINSIGDDPDEGATSLTEELTNRLESHEKSLSALQRAEAQLGRATAAGTSAKLPAVIKPAAREEEHNSTQEMIVSARSAAARPFAAPAKKVRPSDFLFKAITADIKHFAEGRKRSILEVVKNEYGDQSDHGECVRTVMSHLVTKAAAIPADTTTSGWADTLVQTVIGDFIDSLMPLSVYPKLAAKGGSFTFGRNGVISLPARNQSTTLAGSFVAQGAAIPVRQGAFTGITLTPKKMGVITTMTREITEHSTPAIEAILRQAILDDTAVAIDTVLLDANAATAVRPAGLKNGITKVTASGTASIVGFIADLKALVAALITATNGNIRNPVWIMNPGDVLAAGLLQTTTGDTPFRDEIARGTLLGYPIVTTTTGLNDMMGIIDAADFITATGDAPQFSVSDQAVLHMEDTAPAQISTVATPNSVAAPVRSLWQTDSIAIRMLMDLNWAKRRTGIFQWTDTMAWN